MAREHALEDEVARAYRSLLFYAILIHDFARAERLFREGVAHCEERGILSHGAYMRAYFAPCELDRGRWTEAAAISQELLRSPDITGIQQRITLMVTLAIVRARRGDPGAEDLLEEALRLALPTCELNRVGRVAAARAEHAWFCGDMDRVMREAAVGLSQVNGHTAPWIKGELLWWQSRVEPMTSIPSDVAQPFQLMLSGDWRAAATEWEGIGMPYEQALALAEGPEGSQREALHILERLGAGPLSMVVRRRLRECGAKGVPRGPRDTTRANPQGLTSKEIQVLSLLALGDSNAQLGRRLHRSTKTIDHHVSSILGKLGVRSRAEALASAYALGIIEVRAQHERPDPIESAEGRASLPGSSNSPEASLNLGSSIPENWIVLPIRSDGLRGMICPARLRTNSILYGDDHEFSPIPQPDRHLAPRRFFRKLPRATGGSRRTGALTGDCKVRRTGPIASASRRRALWAHPHGCQNGVLAIGRHQSDVQGTNGRLRQESRLGRGDLRRQAGAVCRLWCQDGKSLDCTDCLLAIAVIRGW